MDENIPNPMLVDPDMKEIFDSFIVETNELLERLDFQLVELEKTPDNTDLLNDVFRSFHTVKGTSGFLGLEKLTKVTHKCEDILNKLRKGEAKLNSSIMDGILNAFDKIKELVVCIETNKNENVEIDETLTLLAQIIARLEAPGGADEEEPAVEEPAVETAPDETPAAVEEIMAEQTAAPAIEEVKLPPPPPKPAPKKEEKEPAKTASAAVKKEDNSIRVDVERLDELLNIVSELVLGRNRLAQVNSEMNLEYEGTKIARDLSEAAKQIDLMTSELQLVVMKTRMVKIGKVFNRYPRIVRDLAKETKKSIQLVINGEETELDKTLIEEINDPLVHLIRNSADHGVETPDIRQKLGKNPVGTITLSAEHEGNNIIISVEDDGKGMDPEMLKEKAIKKGLITKEKAKDLSRQETFNLIFLPGFSTAEVVTNVSGRGVGMDVVKTNVTKLRGIINIESNVGKGTKMIIKLPLTLAIIPGMIVKIKSETVVIPLNSVIEVLRVNINEIKSVNQTEVIRLRDSVLPLLSLDKILAFSDMTGKEDDWQYVVIVGIAERKFGIKVDDLIGQKEVVIKSLGNYLGNIHGIAGSTIMGDGKVVMILDIAELVNNLMVEN
jgi:two-component system chemotaxis sensor kinase CheA